MSKVQQLKNTLRKLDDRTSDISVSTERIKVLTADILENYFSIGIETPQQREKAIYNYENFYIKADILMDYVSKLLEEVAKLQGISDKLFDLLKKAIEVAEKATEVTAND